MTDIFPIKSFEDGKHCAGIQAKQGKLRET